MTFIKLKRKLVNKLWGKIVAFSRTRAFYPKIYIAYWHYRFSSSNKLGNHLNYYTALPNPGAGIGHQMANWIAGYWFARQFDLQFAHSMFPSENWEQFLGFGTDEICVEDLLKQGYKRVKLPLFNEFNSLEIALNKSIIETYRHQRVLFVAEQDQYYKDQFGVIDDLQRKFNNALARKNDALIYSNENFNIAIHVRRGDIVGRENPSLLMRWQDLSYFKRVLDGVVSNLKQQKPIAIYLFSQGDSSDFSDFEQFENLHFCLDMDAQNSFLHMVKADLLITSKSSFSYKPALLSKGIKVCPRNFWHGYPNIKNWILVEDTGLFDINLLK